MYLRSLEIKNYRSLEHVQLGKLGRFNVLIGRNNSGKSAVFGAVTLLNNVIRGASVDWETVLTDKDKTRSLEMRLLFETRPEDREEFIDVLGGAGHARERAVLINSALLRQIEFLFKAPRGLPQNLHLRQTRVLGEDNRWAVVQKMVGNEDEGNPLSQVVNIGAIAKRHSSEPLRADFFELSEQARIHVQYAQQGPFHADTATRWALTRLDRYLSKAFFFNPFRHSTARLTVRQTDQLAQDGSNLAQVLHTINSNNRELLARIEKFVHAALPDIGMLQPPLINQETEVSFRFTPGDYMVRLHDMGGGIE
ncbi:MAG: AAA family ATPase, partial [Nitrososphaera sp.]